MGCDAETIWDLFVLQAELRAAKEALRLSEERAEAYKESYHSSQEHSFIIFQRLELEHLGIFGSGAAPEASSHAA